MTIWPLRVFIYCQPVPADTTPEAIILSDEGIEDTIHDSPEGAFVEAISHARACLAVAAKTRDAIAECAGTRPT